LARWTAIWRVPCSSGDGSRFQWVRSCKRRCRS